MKVLYGVLQEEMQRKAAGLEAEIQAERRAQRDLKLVLAAAEKQAQQDSNERREVAVRCSAPPFEAPLLHTQAITVLPEKCTDAECVPELDICHYHRVSEASILSLPPPPI